MERVLEPSLLEVRPPAPTISANLYPPTPIPLSSSPKSPPLSVIRDTMMNHSIPKPTRAGKNYTQPKTLILTCSSAADGPSRGWVRQCADRRSRALPQAG